MFVEIVGFLNVGHDRAGPDEKTYLPGESRHETALRLERLLNEPPKPPPTPAVVVPLEDRDPDAPPGWYDQPDMSALWLPGSLRQPVD